MSLQEQIEQAYKESFRTGQKSEVLVFRSIKAALKNEEIALRAKELTDSQTLAVLQREMKRRKDAIDLYSKGGRAELAATEQAESAIIQRFLPAELSDAELQAIVQDTIKQIGASAPADQGKVMKAVMPKVQGRADGGKYQPWSKHF